MCPELITLRYGNKSYSQYNYRSKETDFHRYKKLYFYHETSTERQVPPRQIDICRKLFGSQ